MRSRLFFVDSLQKWPKREMRDEDEDFFDEEDCYGVRPSIVPRKLALETISDERMFDLLPQLFNPVLKVDVEAGDDAAFCLKV